MKFRVSKTPTERLEKFFAEAGEVAAATEVIDGHLKSIVLTSLHPFSGDVVDRLTIKMSDNYSTTLQLIEVEPPKMVDRYAVRGTFFGNAFERVFNEYHEAESLRSKMCSRTDEEDVHLEVVAVQVPEEAKS